MLVDLFEKLVVEVVTTRRVARCPDCGFPTDRVPGPSPKAVRDEELKAEIKRVFDDNYRV